MMVILPTSTEHESLRAKLRDWTYAIPPWGESLPDRCVEEHDHWLGSSPDGSVWGMSIYPSAPRKRTPRSIKAHEHPGSIVAFLLDPPKRDPDTIALILFRVHGANSAGPLSDEQVESLVRSTPFPTYRKVRAYFPEAPPDWLDWPAELVVGFGLSEGSCISQDLFRTFKRETLRDALGVVCGPREEGLIIGYSLAAREIVPLLRWNVDWPLSRQGGEPPYRRKPVQKDLPWEEAADLRLFSVYQQVKNSARTWEPLYYGRPVVHLRVGGRSREAAVANWHRCARALRRLKPDSVGPGARQAMASEPPAPAPPEPLA